MYIVQSADSHATQAGALSLMGFLGWIFTSISRINAQLTNTEFSEVRELRKPL